jgi:hypothetical protein
MAISLAQMEIFSAQMAISLAQMVIFLERTAIFLEYRESKSLPLPFICWVIAKVKILRGTPIIVVHKMDGSMCFSSPT